MTNTRARLLAAGTGLLIAVSASACSSRTDPTAEPAVTSAPAADGSPAPAVDVTGPAVSAGAQAYVDAVNSGDLDALVAAFTDDGEVVDVTRRIRGPEAIRTWAGNEVIGGALRVDAVEQLAPDRQRVRVQWAPGGSGGWPADYTFTTRGGQVIVADLQYAS
jgi:SnoaL-like domain